jgi:hypothetical protein
MRGCGAVSFRSVDCAAIGEAAPIASIKAIMVEALWRMSVMWVEPGRASSIAGWVYSDTSIDFVNQ